jgi:hypothetical protein
MRPALLISSSSRATRVSSVRVRPLRALKRDDAGNRYVFMTERNAPMSHQREGPALASAVRRHSTTGYGVVRAAAKQHRGFRAFSDVCDYKCGLLKQHSRLQSPYIAEPFLRRSVVLASHYTVKENLLSQKKRKSRKMNRTRRETTRNRRKPRAIALSISEPKLRGRPAGNGAVAREDKPLRPVEHKPLRVVEDEPLRTVAEVAQTESKPSSALPLPQTTMLWSPWNVMLRQQAFMVHALSNMMRAQHQFARMLSS